MLVMYQHLIGVHLQLVMGIGFSCPVPPCLQFWFRADFGRFVLWGLQSPEKLTKPALQNVWTLAGEPGWRDSSIVCTCLWTCTRYKHMVNISLSKTCFLHSLVMTYNQVWINLKVVIFTRKSVSHALSHWIKLQVVITHKS